MNAEKPNLTIPFSQEDLDKVDDLQMYLGGLRDLLATDLADDPITIERQYLHALVGAAFTKAERVYCDLLQRLCDVERPAEEGGAE
jgi:hypothetical protein